MCHCNKLWLYDRSDYAVWKKGGNCIDSIFDKYALFEPHCVNSNMCSSFWMLSMFNDACKWFFVELIQWKTYWIDTVADSVISVAPGKKLKFLFQLKIANKLKRNVQSFLWHRIAAHLICVAAPRILARSFAFRMKFALFTKIERNHSHDYLFKAFGISAHGFLYSHIIIFS